MGQTIYVVMRSEGQYEDTVENVERAFYDKNDAEKYIESKNKSFDNVEQFRSEWEEIELALEDSVSEDYWNSVENISEESQEIPEYWSDNKDTFIKFVKEIIPEIYEKYGEDLLLEMYGYYEDSSHKWNGQPYFYISETEIE
jgi:trans-2-enoyl-CoA reductase